MANTEASCVIDTGSIISCISTKIWKTKLPEVSQWRLRSAAGEITELYEPVQVPIELNDKTVRFPVFVANITDECLLGVDFLTTYKAQISLNVYTVKLTLPDGQPTAMYCSGPSQAFESRRLFRTLRTTEKLHVDCAQLNYP